MLFLRLPAVILTMNKVPNILDNSHGMWRRIWMIDQREALRQPSRDILIELDYNLRREIHWNDHSPNSFRSQKLIFRIVNYSIYSEVLSQKTGFWVYGREFASFTC